MNVARLTNNSLCHVDTSLFASSHYLSTTVHLVTVFSVPFNAYGFYCIIKLTPRQMTNAKWVLLNVHTWTIVLDVVFNFLSIPMMFFPSTAGVMLGFGQYLGIPSPFLLYAIQALVCVYGTGFIALFENRQNTLATRWKIKRTWMRVILNIFNYSVATVTVLPPYLTRGFKVEMLALEILKKIPCPSIEFFRDDMFILTDNPALVTLLMFLQTIFLVPQATCFITHTLYHLVYLHNSRVSPETRKMQLKFFIGSIMQCVIPSAVLMCPVLYIWISIHTGYYNQQLNNHIILTASFHGLFTSICLIMVHKSYRSHFIKMITLGVMDLKKVAVVKVSSVVSVSHGRALE